jgi:GT2 family glycosyltransferase
MPFAGTRADARAAVSSLARLATKPGDDLILADNSGVANGSERVTVVRVDGEPSPAHARNVGAEHAGGEWILFIDSDCQAPPGLLDAYFAEPVAAEVGALAGEVDAETTGARSLAARYGAARGFLSQRAHLAHPYMPRAVAANLMVRRSVFEQLGGFYEGIRTAEDTDFAWRLQRAGWRLELRPEARVEHRHRATVAELRRQWRGYAAGRAWLSRRYDGFEPEPAVMRVVRRSGRRGPAAHGGAGQDGRRPDSGRIERARFLALDALLAVDELAGFTLSNRPAQPPTGAGDASVVLVAGRFPAVGDPLVEFARTLDAARVEAVARPDVTLAPAVRELRIDYREDDGTAERLAALLALLVRHPLRSLRDALGHVRGDPSLLALAPAARRLEHQPDARVHPLGDEESRRTAHRLAALARAMQPAHRL